MHSINRNHCIGDQVRITGFLGRFDVIELGLNGSMVHIKHLGLPGPDYFERYILAHELNYLNVQKLAPPANLHAQQLVGGPK
jgi:hypothetical protein